MKIATLVVFKNEADILPYWLDYMDKHVDYFLFRDNESTDGGGDIVREHPKTVYCDIAEGIFTTSMTDVLFERVQDILTDNDWICGGAADLLPYFDVRQQIEDADRAGFTCIKAYFPTFFFTQEMHERYNNDPGYKAQVHNFDIRNYSHYLNVSNHIENMFKNTKDSKGNRIRFTKEKQEPPCIPNKKANDSKLCWGHFRFRSPKQMQERLSIRSTVNQNREEMKSFSHYPTWDWEEYLIPQNRLFYYDGHFNTKRYQLDSLITEGQ